MSTPWRGFAEAPSSLFVGRNRELGAIAASADAAEAGRMQVVWVEGRAGSGKTTLVRQCVDGLRHRFQTLWCEAVEYASNASYALVAQLGPISTTSPFAAGLELVDRLGSMQADRPVAVVAEDVHWADSASRGALVTAVRRLYDDQVLMVLTARPAPISEDWERVRADSVRCRQVDVAGLGVDEVSAMAAGHGVALTEDQARRLHDHTAGSPLYVRTLLHELSADQLRSDRGGLPAPRSLAAATLAVVADVPRDAEALAAALAVLGTRSPLAVAGTVAGLDDPAGALEPLLSSGLVQWWPSEDGMPIGFAHPLHRAAVYDDLAPRRRRMLHLAAADATRWGPSWAHRVAAADSTDDELADELDEGARYELDRGDLALAATYLSWASTVTSTRGRAEERLLRGAWLLIVDGQTSKAAALFPRIADCDRTALRDLVLGALAFAQAAPLEAERWLDQVATAPEPGATWVRADALARLGQVHVLFGRGAEAAAAAKRAFDLGPVDDDRIERMCWWDDAVGTAMTSGAPAGLARLASRLPEPAGDVAGLDAELLFVRGMLRMLGGESAAATVDLRTAIELARRGFGFQQLPRAHVALSRALYLTGEWAEALAHGHNAMSLMDDHRVWMRGQPEGALAVVLAARGAHEIAAEYAAIAVRDAADISTFESVTGAQIALAAVSEAQGDARAVIEALQPLLADGDKSSLASLTCLAWWPTLIRALIAVGDSGQAIAHVEQLESVGAEQGLDTAAHVAGLRARIAAAHGDGAAATAGFDEAVARLGPDHPWLERALLHHAYGQTLRARGARRAAGHQLRIAHEMLDSVSAAPYREAVARDLADLEGRTHAMSSPPGSRPTLTSREQDVVALVQKGYTNREVGAQLYISAKAVAFHLGNVYTKLGINSRRALRDLA